MRADREGEVSAKKVHLPTKMASAADWNYMELNLSVTNVELPLVT